MEGVDSRVCVRVKVSFSACVRTEAFGDDSVQCMDMSRGGLVFRSSHRFYKGLSVQMAVAFFPDAKEAPGFLCESALRTPKSWLLRPWRCGVGVLELGS